MIVMLIALRMPIVMVLMMQTMVVFDGTEGIDNSGVDGTVIAMLMVPMMIGILLRKSMILMVIS